MNNHHKVISLHVVPSLPPPSSPTQALKKNMGRFFQEKAFHSNSEGYLGYLTVFIET